MDEKNLKSLYDFAVSNKLDIGDYNSFKKGMEDSANRKSFHEFATQNKLDIGGYDEFESNWSDLKKKATSVVSESPLPDGTSSSVGNEQYINDNDPLQQYPGNRASAGTSPFNVVPPPMPATPPKVPQAVAPDEKGVLSKPPSSIDPLKDLVNWTVNTVKAGQTQNEAVDESLSLLTNPKGRSDKDIQDFIKAVELSQSMPPSKAMQDYNRIYKEEGEDVWAFVKALANNPSVAPEVMLSSLSAMMNEPSLAAAGGVVGTAAAGGAILGGGIGAIPAAIGSLPYAMAAAGTVLEATTSFTEFLQTELAKQNKDLTIGNVRAILEDDDKMNVIRAKAAARGLIIGSIDAFASKLAGRVGAKMIAAGSPVKGVLASTGIEAASGSGGEAAARVATGQKMDVSEIGLEGIGVMGQSPIDIFSAARGGTLKSKVEEVKGIQATKDMYAQASGQKVYKINGENVSQSDIVDIVKASGIDELKNINFDVVNDQETSDLINDRLNDLIMQDKVKKANPDLPQPEVEKVAVLEHNLAELKDNDTESANIKRTEIKKELVTKLQGLKREGEDVAAEPAANVTPAELPQPPDTKQPEAPTVAPEPKQPSQVAPEQGATKPISKLGTGANVYYETPKLRVNEIKDGKVLLNISDNTDSPFPMANIEFDTPAEAVKIAERLNQTYPEGVPPAVLIEKVVDGWRNEMKQPDQVEAKPKEDKSKTQSEGTSSEVSTTNTEPNGKETAQKGNKEGLLSPDTAPPSKEGAVEQMVKEYADRVQKQTNNPTNEPYLKIGNQIAEAIANKDVKTLRKWMNGVNPNINRLFTKITGLPAKLQREADASIKSLNPEAWAAEYEKPVTTNPKMTREEATAKMLKAKAEETLNKKGSYDGVIKTKRQHVKDVIANGGRVDTKEVNKYKEPSRIQSNRMNNEQQEASDRKIREGGKVTEYRLFTPDNSFYTITKAEYDYANSLTENPQDQVVEKNNLTTPEKSSNLAEQNEPNGKNTKTTGKPSIPDEIGLDERQPSGTPDGTVQQGGTPKDNTGRSGQSRRPLHNVDQKGSGPATGERDKDVTTGTSRSVRDEGSTTDTGQGVGEDLPGRDKLTPDQQNHVIEPGDVIVPHGETSKVRANINAIKLAKQLETEKRNATPAEKKILAQYTGWGGLPKIFEREWGSDWANKYGVHADELKAILTNDEWQAAKQSTINAHYTARGVIDAMWKIADKLGFKGGNVLEPAGGIGHFFGIMPEKLSKKSSLYGYELDNISGLIFSKLYPEANIKVTGYENSTIPNNSMDMVITNVPFGSVKVYDKANKDISDFQIHNYFIAKSLRKLKPGGLGVFITTSATMDNEGGGKKFRTWANSEDGGNCDLVDAIRLPNNAFKENAGTEVTTDILVFRKRTGERHPAAKPFLNVESIKETETQEGKPTQIRVNEYFAQNPDRMLGEMQLAYQSGSGGLYTADSQTLAPKEGVELNKELDRVIKSFASDIHNSSTEKVEMADSETSKEGSIHVVGGKPKVVRGGKFEDVDWNNNKVAGKHTKAQVVTDYNALKKAVKKQIEVETTNSPDAEIEKSRKELNKEYDNFTKKYGELSNNSKINFLKDDVENSLAFMLENVKETIKKDENGVERVVKEATKSDIFTKRVSYPRTEPGKADNIHDAANISISYRNGLDLDYVAKLLDVTPQEAKKSIVDSGIGFLNPETGKLEDMDSYLSGNVKKKLEAAKLAAEIDPTFEINVKKLEEVIPRDIPYFQIAESMNLGATWIPDGVIEDFIKKATGVTATVSYNTGLSKYFLREINGQWDAKNTNEYAGGGVNATDLIKDLLNTKATEVFETIDKKQVKNQQKSAEAQSMQKQLQLLFRSHISELPEGLRGELEKIFNDKYNAEVEKVRRDPKIERFPGMVEWVKLRTHQAKAIIRGVREATLLAHQVGTGKTFELIGIAMEMRRLMTAKKPMIVVQKATMGQFVSDFRKIYPDAKILTPSEKDMSAQKRKDFFAKIAYNDWDAIIIHHDALTAIPDNKDRQVSYLNQRIEELTAIIQEADRFQKKDLDNEIKKINDQIDEILYGTGKKKKKKKTVKQEANEAVKTGTKIVKQFDRKTDDLLTFEQLGVDALLVDEAHTFKRLGFETKGKNIKGIDKAGSKKSLSAKMKTSYILENNDNKNVVFATGTPISNTMAEIWTMMKYLIPDKVKEYGVSHFDEFKTTFGEVKTGIEFSPTGEFRTVERFSEYIALPVLKKLFRSTADIVLTKDIPDLKPGVGTPRIKNDEFTHVFLDASDALNVKIKYFADVLRAWEALTGKEKRDNRHIPLVVFGLAKRAAIDVRLVDSSVKEDPGSKTSTVVENAYNFYKESNKFKGTQLIFSDAYRSSDGKFNLYHEIKRQLVDKGIPENEIQIIGDYTTDKKREDLFKKVNSGEVRFLLGSTDKLGIGVNVQERLFAVHHVDAPNRPMDFEQRNGRIIRQGNILTKMDVPVNVMMYGVRKTQDATAYDRLRIKQGFIDQALSPDMDSWTLEEDDGDIQGKSFGQMMAEITGSKYAIPHQVKSSQLKALEIEKNMYKKRQIDANFQLNKDINDIPVLNKYKEDLIDLVETVKKSKIADGISKIKVNGAELVETKDQKLSSLLQDKIHKVVEKINAEKVTEAEFLLNINDAIPIKVTISKVKTGFTMDYELIGEHENANIKHSLHGSDSGVGLLMSIKSQLDIEKLNNTVDRLERNVEIRKGNIKVNQELIKGEWPKAEKLDKLKSEVKDLHDKMIEETKATTPDQPVKNIDFNELNKLENDNAKIDEDLEDTDTDESTNENGKYYIKQGGDFVEVKNAEPVTLEVDGDYFIYKEKGNYAIHEGSTGLSAVGLDRNFKTPESAIAKANELLSNQKDRLAELFSNAIKNTGLSPRYKIEDGSPTLVDRLINKLNDLKNTNKPLDGTVSAGFNMEWNNLIDNVISIIESNRDIINRVADAVIRFKQSDLYKSLTDSQKQAVDNDIKTIYDEVGYPPTGAKPVETAYAEYEGAKVRMEDLDQISEQNNFTDYQRNIPNLGEAKAEADRLINEGYDIQKIYDKGKANEPLSVVEQDILAQHVLGLAKKVESDPSDVNLSMLKEAVDAARHDGSLQGLGLKNRQFAFDPEESVANRLIDYMGTAFDRLTTNQKDFVTKMQTEIADLKAKLEIKEKERLDAQAKADAEEALKEMRKRKSGTRTKADVTKDLDAVFASMKVKWAEANKKKMSQFNSMIIPVPYAENLIAIAPEVMKATKLLVDLGVVSLKEITGKLKEQLGDEVTEKDLLDIIAGKYNQKSKERSDLAKQLQDLRTEAIDINEFDALLNKTEPRSESAKMKRNARMTNVRQRIIEFKKKQREESLAQKRKEKLGGLTDAEYKDKQKLAAYKKNMQKQIDFIEKELQRKDLIIPQQKVRKPVSLDKEGIAIKDELIALRQQYQARKMHDQWKAKDWKMKTLNILNDILNNTTRGLMASTDFSMAFLQNGVMALTHPVYWGKAAYNAAADMISEKRYNRWMEEMHSDSRFEIAKEAGISITDPKDPALMAAEEMFRGNMVDKIPLIGKALKINGKGYGGITTASSRAFSSMGNRIRMEMMYDLIDVFESQGRTMANDPKTYKATARLINGATGQAKYGKAIEPYAKAVSAVLWSPKMYLSQLEMLTAVVNPKYMFLSGPEVRKQVVKNFSKYVGISVALLGMMKLMEDDDDEIYVETSPLSSDFGKVRIGNTRYGLPGNLTQWIVLASQLAMGEEKSSRTGKSKPLGTGFAQKSRGDLLLNFFRKKMSPTVSLATNLITGQTILGEDVTAKKMAGQYLIPISLQNYYEVSKNEGLPIGLISGTVAITGLPTTTYPTTGWYPTDSYSVNGKKTNALGEDPKDADKELWGILSKQKIDVRPPEKSTLKYWDDETDKFIKLSNEEYFNFIKYRGEIIKQGVDSVKVKVIDQKDKWMDKIYAVKKDGKQLVTNEYKANKVFNDVFVQGAMKRVKDKANEIARIKALGKKAPPKIYQDFLNAAMDEKNPVDQQFEDWRNMLRDTIPESK